MYNEAKAVHHTYHGPAELHEKIKVLHAEINAGDRKHGADLALRFIKLRTAFLLGENFEETGSLEVFKLMVKRITGEMCPYRPGTFGFYTGRRENHQAEIIEQRGILDKHFGQMGYRIDDLLPCKNVDDLVFGIEVLFVLSEFRQRAIKGTGPVTPPPAN